MTQQRRLQIMRELALQLGPLAGEVAEEAAQEDLSERQIALLSCVEVDSWRLVEYIDDLLKENL